MVISEFSLVGVVGEGEDHLRMMAEDGDGGDLPMTLFCILHLNVT